MDELQQQTEPGGRKERTGMNINTYKIYTMWCISLLTHPMIIYPPSLPSPPLSSALPHSVYGVNVEFTFSVYLNLSFLLQCSRGKALTLCLLCYICQTVEESRAWLQSHLTVSAKFWALFPIILAGQKPLDLSANVVYMCWYLFHSLRSLKENV